jgi:hypothetical protein
VAEVIGLLCDTGDLGRAIECAHRSLAIDPMDEDLHITLMRLYAAAGQPSAVARQFRVLRCVIENELGETVAPSLCRVAEQLQELARYRSMSGDAVLTPIMSDNDDNKSLAVAVNVSRSNQSGDRSKRLRYRPTRSAVADTSIKPAPTCATHGSEQTGSLPERMGLASRYRSSDRILPGKDACLAPGAK